MKLLVGILSWALLTSSLSGISYSEIVRALKPLSGSKAEAPINQGVQSYTQGQWHSAHQHFNQAVQADPQSAIAHYNLALSLDKMGKQREAAKHFQKAQSLGKYNPFIRNSKILKNRLPGSP